MLVPVCPNCSLVNGARPLVNRHLKINHMRSCFLWTNGHRSKKSCSQKLPVDEQFMTEKCAVCAQSCLFPECIINCIRARSHSSTGMNPFVHKCNLQIVSIYPHKGICLFISRIIPTLILELNIPLFAIEYCPICQRALAHSTYSNGKRGTTKNWEELVSCQKNTQHKTHKNIIAEP